MDNRDMENNQTEKNRRNPELVLLIFVLMTMGLVVIDIFNNIISQLIG